VKAQKGTVVTIIYDDVLSHLLQIEFFACSSSKCVRSSRCFPELSIT